MTDFDKIRHADVSANKISRFQKFKMEEVVILKIKKIQYLCNGTTDFAGHCQWMKLRQS